MGQGREGDDNVLHKRLVSQPASAPGSGTRRPVNCPEQLVAPTTARCGPGWRTKCELILAASTRM